MDGVGYSIQSPQLQTSKQEVVNVEGIVPFIICTDELRWCNWLGCRKPRGGRNCCSVFYPLRHALHIPD